MRRAICGTVSGRCVSAIAQHLPARRCEAVLGCEPVAGREQQPIGAKGRQDHLGGLLPYERSGVDWWPERSDEGWTERREASAFAELMSRLRYERYGAQGGDMGAVISPNLGRVDADAGIAGGHATEIAGWLGQHHRLLVGVRPLWPLG
jgi:hypothetical protein